MHHSVSFLSEGHKLVANLHIPRKNAPVVVFCHGLASSKDSEKWLTLACKLHDEGFAALRFTFRGCGSGDEWSEGKFEESTLTNRVKGYLAALAFLQQDGRVDVGRLGVIGSSLGVCTALAGGSPLVKAYVLLASPPKMMATPEMLQSFAEKGYFEWADEESRGAFRITQALFDDFQRYDMFKLIKQVKCPVLMVQGGSDRIPIKLVRELYSTANEPKKLEIIEGGSHQFSDNPVHLAKVIEMSVDWFKRWV